MLGSGELAIVVAVVLLLFGGSRIPALARDLGRAQAEFRRGFGGSEDGDATSDDASASNAS